MSYDNILIASTNPAKQRRLRWLLEGLPIHPVTPAELEFGELSPGEEGGSHEEVARNKARGWSRAAAMPATSSDGGLVIPALGREWESLLTHRFAGEEADDAARVARLMDIMSLYSGEDRGAFWVEALAIAQGDTIVASWEVKGPTGLLLEDPGPGPTVPGFWVFSLWYFPHLGKTYNQMEEGELEGVNDHWGQLKPLVQDYFRREL